MKNNQKVDKLSYNDLLDNYKQDDFFDEAVIYIKYTKNILSNDNGERLYKIIGLELDISDSDERKEKLKRFIDICNEAINKNKYPKDWQIFIYIRNYSNFS